MTRLLMAGVAAILALGAAAGTTDESRDSQPPTYALVRLWPARSDFLTNPRDEDRKTMSAHFTYMKKLHAEGKVAHAGRTLDNTRLWGVIILRTSEVEAARLMAEDPAIRAGIQKFETFSYALVLGGLN